MKKWVWMLLLLVALAGGLVLTLRVTPQEPRYDGKPLSYYVAHWYHSPHGGQLNVDPIAKEAVRQIGTNGLRYYVEWMGRPMRWSTDTDYQSWALHAFEVLGPTAKPAVPDLIKLLGTGGNHPALALAYIGPEAIPALTNFLAHPVSPKGWDRNRRIAPWRATHHAIEALSYMGTNAEAAVPSLIRCLQIPESRSQAEAAGALAVVGRNRPELVVPVLIEALTNSATSPRASVAEALGTFGAQAQSAVPALRLACRDQDDYVQIRAAAALKQITPQDPTALEPLIHNLSHRMVPIRQQALWALESLGTNGVEALPALTRTALRDPDPNVRTIAIRCTVRLGTCSEEVLAEVVDNLSHPNEYVRSESIQALAHFAAHSQLAFAALVKAKGSPRAQIREQADTEVTLIANQNPSLLVACFEHPEPEVRYRAFQALYSDVGVETQTAVKALTKALQDEDLRVRKLATNTLRSIDPRAAKKAGVGSH